MPFFTVSWSHLGAVRRYIAAQEAHHAKAPFMDELKRNGVAFDPEYLV